MGFIVWEPIKKCNFKKCEQIWEYGKKIRVGKRDIVYCLVHYGYLKIQLGR